MAGAVNRRVVFVGLVLLLSWSADALAVDQQTLTIVKRMKLKANEVGDGLMKFHRAKRKLSNKFRAYATKVARDGCRIGKKSWKWLDDQGAAYKGCGRECPTQYIGVWCHLQLEMDGWGSYQTDYYDNLAHEAYQLANATEMLVCWFRCDVRVTEEERAAIREAEQNQVKSLEDIGNTAAPAYKGTSRKNTWKVQITTGTTMLLVPVLTMVEEGSGSDFEDMTHGGWLGGGMRIEWWPWWHESFGIGIGGQLWTGAPKNFALQLGPSLYSFFGDREGWLVSLDVARNWLLVSKQDRAEDLNTDKLFTNPEVSVNNWRTTVAAGFYMIKAGYVREMIEDSDAADGFGVFFNAAEFAKIEVVGFPDYPVFHDPNSSTGWYVQVFMGFSFAFYGKR